MPPDPTPPPSPDATLLTSHEWVRWLSGPDATLLLLTVFQHIDDPAVSREALVELAHGWRRQALKALTADDWTASVDKYLEVTVDARLYYFSHRLDQSRPPRHHEPQPAADPTAVLRDALESTVEAAGYLLAALETQDLATIRRAVRDIADAYHDADIPPRPDAMPKERPHE
jgi:hypothetical protein